MEPKNKDSRKKREVTEHTEEEVVRKRKKVTKEDPYAPLTDHLEDLRRVLIKSALVIFAMFLIIFSTVGWWFPVVSKGADIVVLGPFEVIRFYLRTSGQSVLVSQYHSFAGFYGSL